MTDKTGSELVDEFLRDRNARAAAKPSPLAVPKSPAPVKKTANTGAPTRSEVMSREIFDEDDFIEARNAAAAARPNPLASKP